PCLEAGAHIGGCGGQYSLAFLILLLSAGAAVLVASMQSTGNAGSRFAICWHDLVFAKAHAVAHLEAAGCHQLLDDDALVVAADRCRHGDDAHRNPSFG